MNATNNVNVKLSYFENGNDVELINKTLDKNKFVTGFQNLKKSCNLLTFSTPNTLFTLNVEGFEIDFYGGKFAPKTTFFVELLAEKIASFENNKKELKKQIATFLLKDKNIFEIVELLSNLETLTKLELLTYATDKKQLYLNSQKNE